MKIHSLPRKYLRIAGLDIMMLLVKVVLFGVQDPKVRIQIGVQMNQVIAEVMKIIQFYGQIKNGLIGMGALIIF